MSIFELKTKEDVRNFVYALSPAVAAIAVSYGVVDEQQSVMWVAFVAAVVGPGLAAIFTRTVDTFRTAFYAILAAAQALLIGYGILSNEQVGVWLPIVTVIIGGTAGAVATQHTVTSPVRALQ